MEELILWKNDPWLEPWKKKIMEVYQKTTIQRLEIAGYGQSLASAVNSHLFYGVFHDNKGNLIFREWAPNSKELYLIGEVNSWKKDEKFRFSDIGDGNRELVVPKKLMPHGSLYKWLICWEGGSGERIPAYATRVVQDLDTKLFSAQIWSPDPYK